jgi:hypothetical protein
MSRASDITLMLILMQAAIGFVDATELFDAHYLDVPQNNAGYTISDLGDYAGPEEPSFIDEAALYIQWAFEAFFIGLKVVFAVLFIFPTLVNVFHVPAALSIFIQAGIYYVYAIWYAQYKSGRGWKQYE